MTDNQKSVKRPFISRMATATTGIVIGALWLCISIVGLMDSGRTSWSTFAFALMFGVATVFVTSGVSNLIWTAKQLPREDAGGASDRADQDPAR